MCTSAAVECYCIYIYIWLLMSPNHVSLPKRYTHNGFSVFFFWTPLFPRNRLGPQNRPLASKFIWRYYYNAFGAPRFSVKKFKMQESACSPGGSKILNEPHLPLQRPYVTKTMVFHFFFLIEQLLSHVCGDIAYSAQRPPRVAYVSFMIYINYFQKSCYFQGRRHFSCQQVAMRAK